MNSIEVLSLMNKQLTGKELIISSNGNISRYTYHLLPKPQLYLRGSMGLPLSIGIGVALAKPKEKVIVITGDGNFLMGLSTIATLGFLSPKNLKILILDNQVYATTGNQMTASSAINYTNLVKSVKIPNICSIDTRKGKENVEEALSSFLETSDLSVLHVLVEKDRKKFENIPWHPTEIASKFRNR
ncbi:MAG: thiamine pyrophosphate-dependent enzyme [Candidatus Heimdallarchaeaceae archaeon]